MDVSGIGQKAVAEMMTETDFALVGVAALSMCATALITVPAVAALLAPRSLRAALLRLPFLSVVPDGEDRHRDAVTEVGAVSGVGDTAGATAICTWVDPAAVDWARTGTLRRHGPYRLDRLLSQSSSGQVWAALDVRDGTPVAFKRPLPHQLASGAPARGAERLTREGIALDEAAGEHVVGLHETGELDGVPFVAMRLATGGTLLDALTVTPTGMDLGAVVEVVGQIADALDDTHRAGWVHRDVKASNVVHDLELGRWLLADFGIAQPHGEPAIDRLTAHGYVVGTPGHLAPELLTAADGDGIASPASDVYALAVLTYQLLTGELPHPGPRLPQHRTIPPLSRTRPEHAALDEVLARALALDPATRYPTPAAFAHTLARVAAVHAIRPVAVADPSPPRAPRTPWPWGALSPRTRRSGNATARRSAA